MLYIDDDQGEESPTRKAIREQIRRNEESAVEFLMDKQDLTLPVGDCLEQGYKNEKIAKALHITEYWVGEVIKEAFAEVVRVMEPQPYWLLAKWDGRPAVNIGSH